MADVKEARVPDIGHADVPVIEVLVKAGDRVEGIERALPPAAQREAARTWLMETLPSEKRRWLK